MKNSQMLLTLLSSEIRAHVNSILDFSYGIKKAYLPDKTNIYYSNQISSSCHQLLKLMEIYIECALTDKNNFKVIPGNIRLSNILETLLSILRSEVNPDNCKEIVLTTASQNSDDLEVLFDSAKVFRAFRGLIHNVINDTKSGCIKIGYQYFNKKLTFYIITASQDMDKYKEFLCKEDLDESMANLNDINSAISTVLAKKIIHLLGGSIWVDSDNNKEAGIFFSVPVEAADHQAICVNEYVITVSQRKKGQHKDEN